MKKLIIAAVVTCLALTGTAQAYWWNNTTTWNGAGDGSTYSSGSNWTSGSAPGGNYWGGGTNSNAVQWYDTEDGYASSGTLNMGGGEQSTYGNNNPGETYLSGTAAVTYDFLNVQVWNYHLSGSASFNGNNLYLSRNGGWLNGAGTTNGIDGSGVIMHDSSTMAAGNITLGLDAGFAARLIMRDSASVTTTGNLQIAAGNTGAVKVTVSKNASLDVGGDVAITTDAYVQTGGTVTVAGDLTFSGTGLLYVGGGSWTLAGDQTAAMATAQGAGQLIATVTLSGGNTILTPEPATMCLLAIGGIGVLVRRRRR